MAVRALSRFLDGIYRVVQSDAQRHAGRRGVERSAGAGVDPDLIEKFKAAFESYWADPDYETVRSRAGRRPFDRAVRATSVTEATPHFPFRPAALAVPARDAPAPRRRARAPSPLPESRRSSHRHRQDAGCRVRLSSAPRAAPESQPAVRRPPARDSVAEPGGFRAVLRDGSFGELLVDGHRPDRDGTSSPRFSLCPRSISTTFNPTHSTSSSSTNSTTRRRRRSSAFLDICARRSFWG